MKHIRNVETNPLGSGVFCPAFSPSQELTFKTSQQVFLDLAGYSSARKAMVFSCFAMYMLECVSTFTIIRMCSKIQLEIYRPLKFKMEPESGPLEKQIPFGKYHFQALY